MRLRNVGLCALLALAIAAMGAVPALAGAPEYGRCIKKPMAGGTGYSNSGCTVGVASAAKYEWSPGPGLQPEFSSSVRYAFSEKHKQCSLAVSEYRLAEEERAQAKTAGEPEKGKLLAEAAIHETAAEEHLGFAELTRAECESRLKTEQAKTPVVLHAVKGITVECGGLNSAGEYTGPKTLGGLTVRFVECTERGVACASAGAAEEEIVSASLDGTLGVVKQAEIGVPEKVGLDLYPATGDVVAEFSCGGAAIVVTGSAIRGIRTDSMLTLEEEKFTQSSGKQKPEAFEGQPADVLSSSLSGAAPIQTGLTLRGLLKNREPIEVNKVV